ncbi:olfactory receptor 1S2-like [Bufo gargarizans]|uniref:olfactory receptor 1S2-like n=1 Tax=Bufo gargarizans TaxID=30331 RepID=UPI001CF2AA41|nr:olfactory receptor 1S2-like [Bufo gargarizans]
MCSDNQTVVSDFLLLGFKTHQNLKLLLFSLFLVIYIVILAGNTMIIISISLVHFLDIPMFIFLKHLATADVLVTTNIIPNMLHVIIMEGAKISTKGCLTQYYFHCISSIAQSLVLTSMSFDRYIAICHPLRYSSVMNYRLCRHLVFCSWATGILLMATEMVFLSQLKFCSSNILDHFFCDFAPILKITSSDTSLVTWEDFIFALLFFFVTFLFVIVSYACIFLSILKISTRTGRQKAFSTCSSHLVTLFTYYCTIITVYIFSVDESAINENKLKSLLYVVLTPFINPIIYSIRNREIRKAFKQLLCNRK